MINRSKLRSRRMWIKWEESGAVKPKRLVRTMKEQECLCDFFQGL